MEKGETLTNIELKVYRTVYIGKEDAIVFEPDCSGVDNWAASMAFVDLKDNSLTTIDKLDFNKTIGKYFS